MMRSGKRVTWWDWWSQYLHFSSMILFGLALNYLSRKDYSAAWVVCGIGATVGIIAGLSWAICLIANREAVQVE